MYKVFINDRVIILTNKQPENPASNSTVVHTDNKKDFKAYIDGFLNNFSKKNQTIFLINSNPELLLSYLKNYTIYIEAAGGLVKNPQDQLLFIYRYGKWDLPKGKKEPQESPDITAKREVIEECGIGGISILSEMPPTYHMYTLPTDQWVLKKTYWYLVLSKDWVTPSPQIDEDISKVIWVDLSDVHKYLENTYASIKILIEEYF